MNKLVKSLLLMVGLVFVISTITGCAVTTAIKKRNLDVQTKMSDSIFLEPVSPSEQIVYVRVRNTTDKDIDIEAQIKNAFIAQGFVVTKNPKEAQFMVQANLLQIGKTDKRTANSALTSTFGGAALGTGLAAITGANSMGSYGAGALIGGLLGAIGDAMIEDIYYTMITDVEIRQRPSAGESIEQTARGTSKQGMSSNLTQNIKSKNVKWKIYRTRVVSIANKVNLDFPEAKPALIKGLTRSLSGLL